MTSSHDDAIAREAARWYARLSNAPTDHADRGRFEAWLLSSPRHAQEYAKFDQLWTDFDSTPRLERLAQALEDRQATLRRQRAQQRRRMLGGGTALGLLSLLTARWWPEPADEPSLSFARSTPRRQMLDQALPDGSRVTLAPDGAIAVRYFKSRREVKLQRGEALFDVAHEVGRPFEVNCASARITVLGTRFAVLRLPNNTTRVSVMAGRVRLARASASLAAGTAEILTTGDVAELTAEGTIQRVRRSAADAQAWRQGRLVFDADSLAEVVQGLSRFSSKPLMMAPSPAGESQLRITAVVQIKDVDAFVRQLPRLAPVRLRDFGGTVIVKPVDRRPASTN